MTTKRGSSDQFLTKLKFSNPAKASDGWIQKNFLIDFDIWNVEIGVRMQKLDQFYERQQGFDGNDGRKHTNWTLTQPNQQQDLD